VQQRAGSERSARKGVRPVGHTFGPAARDHHDHNTSDEHFDVASTTDARPAPDTGDIGPLDPADGSQ
jgi:hypothetical protein